MKERESEEAMSYKYLKTENKEGVGLLIVDRPPANALNIELLAEMNRVFDEISIDDSVRAVVIASANENIFVSGADVRGMSDNLPKGRALSTVDLRIQDVFNKIAHILKPVIAAINGHALGGGCEIALACDFRFMASGKGKIGLTEVGFGLLPGAGGTQRLTRLLGRAKATDLLFTGAKLSAEQALEIGLVDRVLGPEELMRESLSYAMSFTRQAPLALREIKRCINAAWEVDINDGLKIESSAFQTLVGTEDAKEGLKAFLEKRQPNFKGK